MYFPTLATVHYDFELCYLPCLSASAGSLVKFRKKIYSCLTEDGFLAVLFGVH